MLRLRAFFVAVLVFAVVAALPLAARATLLPACEVEVGVTVVAPPPEPMCEVVTAIDDATGETSAAPICDARGASAIAPPRILPVADARIEAAPACGSDGAAPSSLAPRQGDAPAQPPTFAADPAVLAALAAIPPPPAGDALTFAPDGGSPRPGKGRGVFHPPR